MSVYSGTVLAKNPVGYWRLGEMAGVTQWLDETGGGNHLTWNGAGAVPVPSSGALIADGNGAQTFTDQGGSLNAPYSAALHPGDVFTYEFWIRIPNGAIMRRVFDNGSASDVVIYGGGTTVTMTFQAGATLIAQLTGLNDGQWHHVVWTKNGAINHFYMDGIDVTPVYTNATNVPAATPTTIGNYSGGSTCGMDIDEFAIYNAALSAAQVMENYRNGVGNYDVTIRVRDQPASGILLSDQRATSMLIGDAAVTSVRVSDSYVGD